MAALPGAPRSRGTPRGGVLSGAQTPPRRWVCETERAALAAARIAALPDGPITRRPCWKRKPSRRQMASGGRRLRRPGGPISRSSSSATTRAPSLTVSGVGAGRERWARRRAIRRRQRLERRQRGTRRRAVSPRDRHRQPGERRFRAGQQSSVLRGHAGATCSCSIPTPRSSQMRFGSW